jgi:LacI family transcriptional regulator
LLKKRNQLHKNKHLVFICPKMNKKKRYTIQDIANELNTTASTVSRALQDNPRISEKMRKAVKDLADKLDYHPDFRALSLKTGSGRTIGVMVPHIDRHFFSTVLRGIDEVATELNYNVLICQSYESSEKEEMLIKSLLSGKVDGMLVSVAVSTKKADHFELLGKRGIPLVFFDRVWLPMNVSKVVIDDYSGAVASVRHLVEHGCRNIAHFAGPQHINVYKNRTAGYIDTLQEFGLEVKEQLIFHNTITRETGCAAMSDILKMQNRPDAIFSSGDYSALGAIICARENGIKIPDELAVTGFANEPFGAIIDPSLTSVDQHGAEMGRQAASLLIEEMESKTEPFIPRSIVLNPVLIVRKSSQVKLA